MITACLGTSIIQGDLSSEPQLFKCSFSTILTAEGSKDNEETYTHNLKQHTHTHTI